MEVQLTAGSSVTMRSVAEFAGRLGEIGDAEKVVIDVSELSDVDLAFLQVIEVYRAEFARSGRSLALSDRDHRPITSLLSRCGYLEGADPSDVAFWIGEESE